MMRVRNAAVHVVPDRTSIVVGGRQRRSFRQLWIGFGAAAVVLGAVLLVPAVLSATASAGGDGWRAAVKSETARAEAGLPLQDAVTGGQEADLPLFPCRAVIKNDVHVGRIRPDFAGCHVGYDGREVEVAPVEVLATSWRAGTSGMASAFAAGAERSAAPEGMFEANTLFVCRAAYQGGIHPGQAKAGESGCSFGFGGKRIVATTYDVLQTAPWLTWSRATARNLPDTSIVIGNEGGEMFYACRAADRDGLHPGKIKRNAAGCSIVSEGREAILDRFEVLSARWITGRAGTVPVSAYAAGRENGNVLFVCRSQTRDGLQVGKVNEALGGCHVGMLGREVVLPEYEVLAQ